MRERVQIVCFGLVGLIGAAALGAALALDGLTIGGNSCGGGGEEQRCRYIDRTISIGLDLGWFSASVVLAGIVLIVVGILGVLAPGGRLALTVAVVVIALAGLTATEHVSGRLCPNDGRATCGRADEAWGPVLRDPLLELRAEKRRELVGRPVVPGGPVAEARQTLETFRASHRDGWTLLRWLSVGLWFLALILLAARFVRPAWVAGVSVATVGLVSWAVVFDQSHPCAIEGSDCYQGFVTAAAVILSVLIVAVALGIAALARYARGVRSRGK